MDEDVKLYSNDRKNNISRVLFATVLIMFTLGYLIQVILPMTPTDTGRNVRIITSIIWGFAYFLGLPISYVSIPKNTDITNIIIALLFGLFLIWVVFGGLCVAYAS